MSKTKRKLQLASAIVGICVSVYLIVAMIIFINRIPLDAVDALYNFNIVGIIGVVFIFTRLVFCCLMLIKPKAKKIEYWQDVDWKAIVNIILTVICGALYIYITCETYTADYPFLKISFISGSVCELILLALFICAMAIGNPKKNQPNVVSDNYDKKDNEKISDIDIQLQKPTNIHPVQPNITQTQSSVALTKSENVKASNNRIEQIIQLHDKGSISTENMKRLILEEINK